MKINSDRLKLEVRRARVPFGFYLLLLACGATAFYVTFKNQTFQRPWNDYVKYRVAVRDAKGVVPGKQEVRIAGVKVGVMSKSKLVDGQPVITLSLEKKYAPIYRDAKFRLRAVTPLQDMYMAVVKRGTPAAGVLDEKTIVPAEQSTTPVDISRVMQTFDASTRQRLHLLLDGIGKGFKDNGAQLRAAFTAAVPFLQTAKELTSVMRERKVELRRAMTNFAEVTGALGARDRQLAGLVRHGSNSLGELAAKDVPLDQTLRELPPMLDALKASLSTLRTAQTDLDPALTSLRSTARALAPGLDSLRDFAHRARPAFDALQPSLAKLTPLARDLNPAARALSGAFVQLNQQAPAFDRITQQVLPCEKTIRDFFGWTNSVMKFYDAYGGFPRGDNSVGWDSATAGQSGLLLHHTPNCAEGGSDNAG